MHYFLAKKLDAWRPAAVFSTTAELLARTKFSLLKNHPLAGQFDKAGKGIFYVEDWKASSRASLHFDYVHKRDAAALAEHLHPSQSQFLRTVVVSPSKDSDQEVDRRKDPHPARHYPKSEGRRRSPHSQKAQANAQALGTMQAKHSRR